MILYSELKNKENRKMSDNNEKASVDEKLIALQNGFAEKIPEKLGMIEKIRDQIMTGKYSNEKFRVLHNLLHNLAGAGETFGLHSVGSVARDGENFIKSILDNKYSGDWRKEVDKHIRYLGEICADALKKMPEPISELFPGSEFQKKLRNEEKPVFLVEDNTDVAENLAVQIDYYGYQTRLFGNLSDFLKTLEKIEPLVIIMDIRLPDGDGADIMMEVQKKRDKPLPVIFISAMNDLETRLRAVRAGGTAYYNKPVDPARLIDNLDSLVADGDPEPYRVLIVDDSRFLAEHLSTILKAAGMKIMIVTDPLKVMKPLGEFKPDLILMDVYMPGCSGLELGRVIRQQEAFVSIPIVYLSSETDTDMQLEAISLGGDDFLTKPIRPEHLVSTVTSRGRRSRILRSVMDQDGLTGLLNHTRTKEHLDREIERAKRQQGTVSFAMVDIDKFKIVNDTYGHPAGDRVIKNIARMLKQRLRKIDVVGRYGGEEFAVILPDTDGVNAKKIMDDLRIAFSQIKHQHEDTEFKVTFSCGVATYPACSTALSLNESADRALYDAKLKGRNRVEIHTVIEEEGGS